MHADDLCFVIPTYRLLDAGETVKQHDEHSWRNGHAPILIVFDDPSPDDAAEVLDKVRAMHSRAVEATGRAVRPGRHDTFRLFAANLQNAFDGFEPDFFHQNLFRMVDDVVTTIKGSIEPWPTPIEIAYFQEDRRGLPQTKVNNGRVG